MIRLAYLVIAIFILTSCTNQQTINSAFEKGDSAHAITNEYNGISKPSDTILTLDFFDAVPDTIDGCGEYFTNDTTKVTDGRYIFLSNLSDFAVIKFKGKEIFLNRDESESKEINDTSYIAVYKGNGYKAVLTVTKTIHYDEGGFYSGTLQIVGDKKRATFKVHGEVGC